MKRYISFLFITTLFVASCEKIEIADGTPICIQEKIKSFEKSAGCDNAKVDEYEFQSETMYVFDPGTCGADMSAGVMNAKCVSKGYLGGITGNTKINGESFSNAKYIRTVWRKE